MTHLVVALAQELESLGTLVHEDPVQVARLHRADLDGLLSPAHDLVGVDVGCGGKQEGGGWRVEGRRSFGLLRSEL